MDPNIQSRYFDIYSNILQNTIVNYNQTNDTIRQVETGIRQLMRHNIQPGFGTNTNNDLNHTYPIGSSSLYRNPYVAPVQSQNTDPLLHRRMRPINRPSRRQDSRPNTRNVDRQTSINSNRNTLNNDPLSSLFSRFFTNNLTQPNLDNLTPVIVRPTHEEISNATEDISWNVDVGSVMCPITQDRFVTDDIVSRIHHCGHCFSREALRHWFTLSVYCPVCRYDIRSYRDDDNDGNDNDGNDNNGNDNDGNDNDGNDNDGNHDTNDEPMSNNIFDSENNSTTNPVSSDILTSVTRQLNEALNPTQNQNRLNFSNDISNNTQFNNSNNIGDIAFEYIIQTPDNVYSSSSLSNDSLSSLFRDAFLGMDNSNNTR